jgi:hypothetical protein
MQKHARVCSALVMLEVKLCLLLIDWVPLFALLLLASIKHHHACTCHNAQSRANAENDLEITGKNNKNEHNNSPRLSSSQQQYVTAATVVRLHHHH